MSAEVQPRRRRDKKKKKAQLEALARDEYAEGAPLYAAELDIEEEDIAETMRDSSSAEEDDNENFESNESWTFKIIFFILLIILGGVATLVLVESSNSNISSTLEVNNEGSMQNSEPLVQDSSDDLKINGDEDEERNIISSISNFLNDFFEPANDREESSKNEANEFKNDAENYKNNLNGVEVGQGDAAQIRTKDENVDAEIVEEIQNLESQIESPILVKNLNAAYNVDSSKNNINYKEKVEPNENYIKNEVLIEVENLVVVNGESGEKDEDEAKEKLEIDEFDDTVAQNQYEDGFFKQRDNFIENEIFNRDVL